MPFQKVFVLLFVVTLSLFSILRRCFVAWHVLASTRVTNRRNVVLFGERRLLVMVRRKSFSCYFSKDVKSKATVTTSICGTLLQLILVV